MNELLNKLETGKLRERFYESITERRVDVSVPQNRFFLFDLSNSGPAVWSYTQFVDTASGVPEILRKAIERAPRLTLGSQPPPIHRGAILDAVDGWALVYMLDASPGSLCCRVFEDIGSFLPAS